MLAVVLASPFLGLDNFGVAVAVGLQGASRRTRAAVALLVGSLAAAAILLGCALGTASAGWLGPFAQHAGGVLVMGLGLYQIWQQRGVSAGSLQVQLSPWSLLAVGLGVSLDTTIAGVAFGLRGDPIVASAAIVGAITFGMSAAGLELGGSIGRCSGRVSPRVGPGALVAVGLGISTGFL